MRIRIGANPIGWSNDDLRTLGGNIPLEVCLAQAREAGFEGMELGHKFPREPRALARALAPYGLACVSGWHSSGLLEHSVARELENLRPHLELLKAMGCEVLVFAETTGAIHGDRSIALSKRPVISSSGWAEFGRRVTAVAEVTLAEGVRLVYHHHMGTVVQSATDVETFMASTGPAVHLLLDTGHATFAGIDPTAVAALYRRRISHMHAKDVRQPALKQARAEDWSFLDAVVAGVFTVPGDGMVDFEAVLRALGPYVGWVVVEAEQDPEKAHPLIFAKLGRANLEHFLKAAGLSTT